MAYTELVIKIPSNYDLSKIQNGSIASKMILNAVENGTPLDKIRTEIKSKIIKKPYLDFTTRERERNDAFLEVLDILDKYEAESEEA